MIVLLQDNEDEYKKLSKNKREELYVKITQNYAWSIGVVGPKEIDEIVREKIAWLGLTPAMNLLPDKISGGMKKRVGIARAIVNNPNYLFCDEPNSGLDPQTAIVIDELIQEITKEFDITTVVVTHDMNSVMGIGEKVMFLYKGDKLWEGSKEDIVNSNVKELDDFVFTNKLMRGLKRK